MNSKTESNYKSTDFIMLQTRLGLSWKIDLSLLIILLLNDIIFLLALQKGHKNGLKREK
jgi:hypothetical protein